MKKKKFWIRLEEPPNLFKKREEVAKQQNNSPNNHNHFERVHGAQVKLAQNHRRQSANRVEKAQRSQAQRALLRVQIGVALQCAVNTQTEYQLVAVKGQIRVVVERQVSHHTRVLLFEVDQPIEIGIEQIDHAFVIN